MASQGRNPELSRRSRRVVVDVPAPIPLEALGSRRLSGTILPHLILRGINHLTLKLPHTRTQIRKNRAQMLQIPSGEEGLWGEEGADIRQAAHVEYLCRPECVCQPVGKVRVMEQQIHPRIFRNLAPATI